MQFQATLVRCSSDDPWGFAWNVSALAGKRLVVAGVDPNSAAGRWNTAQKEAGGQTIGRGDEVVQVNDVTVYSDLRRELGKTDLSVVVSCTPGGAASDTSSPLRRTLRPHEAAATPTSQESSPQNAASPGGRSTESPAKPISPISSMGSGSLPVANDKVKVKNTFIEVSEEMQLEEDPTMRFSRSDPTPIIALRSSPKADATGQLKAMASLPQEEEEDEAETGDPVDFVETGYFPGITEVLGSPDRTPERAQSPPPHPSEPKAMAGSPLLLQQLIQAPSLPTPQPVPEASQRVPPAHAAQAFLGQNTPALPVLQPPQPPLATQPTPTQPSFPTPSASAPPVLPPHLLPQQALSPQRCTPQPVYPYSPQSPQPLWHQPQTWSPSPTSHEHPLQELQSPLPLPQYEQVLHPKPSVPRVPAQTLPLPPGALPPGPVRSPSPGIVSEDSRSEEPCPGNRPVEGESGEDESDAEGPSTASPDSGRRKPTRRGGRRARHRKLAALARQQAAAEAAVQEDSPGVAFGGTEQAEAYASSSVSPEPSAMGPDRPRTATAASSPLTVSPETGVASGIVEDGHQLIGRMVIIIDLVRSPEFNGQWGRVESYDPQMQRFVVRVAQTNQLPGEGPLLAKLRRENLVVPSSDAAPWHLTTLPEVTPMPMASAEVFSRAEPAFIPCDRPPSYHSQPGPAADFEDSVGAYICPLLASGAVRVEPGGALDDSTSPLELSPPQVSVPSRLSGASATSNPTSRSTSSWHQQGPAADFEDSIVGQLFTSPRASPVQVRPRPSPKASNFGAMMFSPGPAAEFEDSVGAQLASMSPDFLSHAGDAEASSSPSRATGGWQPSLRLPKS